MLYRRATWGSTMASLVPARCRQGAKFQVVGPASACPLRPACWLPHAPHGTSKAASQLALRRLAGARSEPRPRAPALRRRSMVTSSFTSCMSKCEVLIIALMNLTIK